MEESKTPIANKLERDVIASNKTKKKLNKSKSSSLIQKHTVKNAQTKKVPNEPNRSGNNQSREAFKQGLYLPDITRSLI
jgi:hypothetical protein